jgi:transmembrane sensor
VADLRLSGLYPLDDSDRTLQLLERSLPIRVTWHNPYWVSIGARL